MWLLYALLSAFFASLVAVFAKVGLKDIDTNTATTIRAVITALFLIGVLLLQRKLDLVNGIVSNHKAFAFIVFSGIAGALSWLFYFLALRNGTVSQVVPIDRLSIVFALVLALLFLGEKLTLMTGLGAVIMTAGAILVALA